MPHELFSQKWFSSWENIAMLQLRPGSGTHAWPLNLPILQLNNKEKQLFSGIFTFTSTQIPPIWQSRHS